MLDVRRGAGEGTAGGPLRQAVRLALAFAVIKVLLQTLSTLWEAHIGWGYFRDEFYYIACGRHLAWGYVDHGPLVAVQARLAEMLFGHFLPGLRLPAAVGGAGRTALTGLLAYALGGRRAAQALSMLGVLIAPQYLALDSFLSMNSFESIFWMTCVLALVALQRAGVLAGESTQGSAAGAGEREIEGRVRPTPMQAWLIFGVSAGLGMLNKPSMVFFLAALGAGMLATREGRAMLLRREAVIGVVLAVLIALPNVLWQMHWHWPTWEFLRNGRAGGKNVVLSPAAFLRTQVLSLQPLTIFLWVPGLVWLMRRRAWRWIGVTFLLFLFLMMGLHAKDYYVSPIYPVLFAAGGVAWEGRRWRPFGRLSAAAGEDRAERLVAFPLYEATLLLGGALSLPMALPVMRPEGWLHYVRMMHLADTTSAAETAPTGPLPQFYADRFGWQEEADEVSRIVAALPTADRERIGILCSNYGEAGALQMLAPGLADRVVSTHNTYWMWGPGRTTGDVLLVISGDTPERLRVFYDSVERVGSLDFSRFQMPFERHHSIYLVRGPRRPLPVVWAEEKHYF